MEKKPDIFNDVIGPVMRGPSSSHTAASWRIAKISLDLLNESLHKALIEFDKDGAWAPNYREQGTTMGIDGGLLGLSITDERMKDTETYALQKNISIDYQVSSFPTNHANTVRLTLWGNSGKRVQIVAISTGGGAFQIQKVDGIKVSIFGDLYEVLIVCNDTTNINDKLKEIIPDGVELQLQQLEGRNLFECKSSKPFSDNLIHELQNLKEVSELALINPVMPIISGRSIKMPFSDIESLIDYAEIANADLGTLGLMYEKFLSGLIKDELEDKMRSIIDIVNLSIDTGLGGTQYGDRILPQQSYLIKKAENDGKIQASVVNQIIANVSALMESKSGMEVVVAIPTAGSCGVVGGLLRALADRNESKQEDLVKAYFAAGLVGAYFAMGPGFSAEEHGCQVECGAASGMAAAGAVQLLGGTAKQALAAASMAIQNMIGLICDPVADRVEVPCLGKNINAAVNAHSSAIMAISGFDEVIPLDQVIETVARVSLSMPTCVKCTGKGGLAVTKTAIQLKQKLKDKI